MTRKKRSNIAVTGVIFGLYCGVMLWLLLDRRSSFSGWDTYLHMLQYNKNFIPFYTIRNYLQVILYRTNHDALKHCIINLVGNVVLFIPAGVMIPKLWPKLRNFFRFFLVGFAAILLVELAQLLTLRGRFDVDDIILNLLGMLLGFVLFHICKKSPARK